MKFFIIVFLVVMVTLPNKSLCNDDEEQLQSVNQRVVEEPLVVKKNMYVTGARDEMIEEPFVTKKNIYLTGARSSKR
uniref:NDBP10 n=1 Tax=Lychas mucronatus TaxID=172552 RepID=A0A0U1SEB0_LYCMC|nr:NDBP10 [Lychas mucronatus]